MFEKTLFHRGRFLIATLTSVAVALGAVVGWYYRQQRRALEDAILQELAAIADVQVRQLVNWRRERLGDGRVLRASATIRIAERVLNSKAPDVRDRADLLGLLRLIEHQYGYTAATLADRHGNIRLDSAPGRIDPDRVREFARNTAQGDDVVIEDLYPDAVVKRPMMALTVPVARAGAFVLAIDPEVFLFPYIKSWPAPSATAETVLGRIEGDGFLFLNELRHQSGTALHLRRRLDDELISAAHAARTLESRTGTDYRGVRVLRVSRPVPQSPWYLSAKIDASEAFAPVRRLTSEMALIIVLIAAVNVAGAGLIWTSLRLGIHKGRERWFQQVANETPAYLWMTSPSGEMSFLNKPLVEFLGGDPEAVTKGWRTFIHPDDAERVNAKISQCVGERSEYVDEQQVRRADGEYRWMIAHGRARFSEDGQFQGYAGSLLDITERKTAEQALRRSTALIATQNQALKLIAKSVPLEETFDVLLRAVEAQSPEMLASILLLGSDGVHVQHVSAPSLPASYREAIDGEPIGPRAGSCGTAAFLGKPVVVEDIATDPLWEQYRSIALEHGLRACWSTPILDEQSKVLGTFALYFRTTRRPNESDWELIDVMTQTTFIAIDRGRKIEALRASEERLRLAVTSGNVGVWEWDLATDRLVWTDQVRAAFGWPGEDGYWPTVSEILETIHPEDRPRVEAALQNAIAGHSHYEAEYRIIRPDGELRWISGKGGAEYDAAGKPLRMRGVSLDITSRKHDEEKIKRSQVQLAQAQRIAHLGSYEWDLATNYVARSEELCNIFGLRQGEFPPTHEAYLERVHPEDRPTTRHTIEEAVREAKPFDFEERIVRPDGEIRILNSQGEWISENGRPTKLVGICQDITERKRVEQEVKALSAKLINTQEEERTRLARELHDDLSQQVAVLSIANSRLKNAIPAELSDARTASAQIQEKLTRLSEDIRRLSHELHPVMLQRAGLAAALSTFCSEFGSLTGIRVSLHAEDELGDVPPAVGLCAYRIVQEALQNVARHAQVREADVSVIRRGAILSVRISDRGLGMNLNDLTTGSGLGLVSMRERARLVNGTVHIESRPNTGTVVSLTVPLPAGAGSNTAAA